MKTEILPATSPEALQAALELLGQGAVIAVPTDTLYGLVVNAGEKAAIRRLYRVKSRPPGKPLPIFIARPQDLSRVCSDIPPQVWPLLRRCWPGALTVILPCQPDLPAELTAGGPTVAVRVPDHPTPRWLLAALDFPLTGTSANRSGAAPPSTAQGVANQLAGRIPLILDGGPCPGDVPSTIVDLSVVPPRIVRPGAIPIEVIRSFLPDLKT
jgi:L-threonylcarbamoyladenylate synthase